MASERPPSFWPRALLAFGWAVTFHLTAVAVAGAWVLVPLFLFPDAWPGWIRWSAVVVTIASALVLLRTSVWVKVPFRPPGRPLSRDEHPRLQALVGEVAAAIGTLPPTEIFLVPDASASAIEVRGGLLLRRRRVLLIGLGLLNTCTVAELRAAIAHELAHFIGGDALLAPVLARVRQGLLRVHDELAGSALAWPLLLYADVFLRVTQSVSREQERWADRAAARVAGADALASLLRRQARADLLYALLLRSVVNVLLAAGLRPRSLYDGLRRFERTAAEQGGDARLEALLAERGASPYDSHPPLDERLSLLAHLIGAKPSRGAASDDEGAHLARALLDDAEAVEERYTAALFDERGHVALTPVEWDDVAARAVKPALDEGARNAHEQVARLFGPERARTEESALRTLLEVLVRPATPPAGASGHDAIADTFRRALQPHVTALLARTLLRRGGVLVVDVGRPFVIRLDGEDYDPEAIAERAVLDARAAERLRETLKELPPVEPSRPNLRLPGMSGANAAAPGRSSPGLSTRAGSSDGDREAKGEERATEG